MITKYYKNHLIKKKLSQIFLTDHEIINKIILNFNPEQNQTIIEIGPGLGALTQHIINITNSCTVIEYDSNLSNRLSHIFNNKNITILNQNVMQTNFYELYNQSQQKLRIIGNLPYHISTEIIIYLFKYIDIIQDMYFMFQKEVAQRILANPNHKAYGRLSIITQYHCNIIPILSIPANSFYPIPKVESMLIQLIPHVISPYPSTCTTQLSKITKLAFSQRRKIIKNSLSTLFNTTKITEKTGIDTKLRAENLTIYQYCVLVSLLNCQHTSPFFNKNTVLKQNK